MNNSKTEAGAVELVLVLAMAAIWAVEVIARDLAIPAAAAAITLAQPRRAAEPAAVEPVSALVAAPVVMARPMPVAAPEAASEPAAVMAMPVAPMAHPLAELQEVLQAMPGKQLMSLAGTRRKASKAVLIAALLAMPV